MDNTIRLQYLEAMGIDVWLPRTSVPTKQTLFSEVVIDDAELEPKAQSLTTGTIYKSKLLAAKNVLYEQLLQKQFLVQVTSRLIGCW